jgi:glycosyltransferase involved in cell wall biosynthesis
MVSRTPWSIEPWRGKVFTFRYRLHRPTPRIIAHQFDTSRYDIAYFDRSMDLTPRSTTPLVTIGVTCFNAANTIGRAVTSALRQEWSNKEIIIVDDASSDASLDRIAVLASLNPEIRVIHHRVNTGLSGALNTIMKEAKGEFVALFDDDDESVPERLSSQWHRIVSYEQAKQCNLILCYSNRNVVKNGKPNLNWVAKGIGREAPEPNGIAVADYVFGNVWDRGAVWGMFGSCTLMARRDTFLTIGPFDEEFRRCAEWDLAVRAAFQGAHFIAVNEPLVTQYKTPGPDKSGANSLNYALRLREKYKPYLKSRRLYRASRAMARAQFHGGANRVWASYGYAILACFLSPVFLWEKVRDKFERARRRVQVEAPSRSDQNRAMTD